MSDIGNKRYTRQDKNKVAQLLHKVQRKMIQWKTDADNIDYIVVHFKNGRQFTMYHLNDDKEQA